MGTRDKKERGRAEKKPIAPKGEGQFEFPANVKQIGSLHKGIKIYIEDYAHTYLNRLGERGGDKNSAAFLIGYHTKELGEDILVISGAVEPLMGQAPQNGEVFSNEDRVYCQEVIAKYFEGLEIVGWARIQPGYGTYLSASDVSNHYLGFASPWDVLFLCDSEAREDSFFAWNQKQDDLEEIPGYFIFYDKNHGMNQFMADSRKEAAARTPIERLKALRAGERPVELAADMAADRSAEKSISMDTADLSAGRVPEALEAEARIPDEGAEESAATAEPSYKKEDELSRINDERAKRVADIGRQKRMIKMMTSVSALLFLACVIMGAGLMQSGERIAKIEEQMTEMRRGYNNIVSKMNDNAYPAFAAQISDEGETVPDAVVASEIDKAMAEKQEGTSGQRDAQKETQQNSSEALDRAMGIETVKDIAAPKDDSAQEAESSQEKPNVPVQQKQSEDDDDAALSSKDAVGTEEKSELTYVIQRGDTLTHISTKFYGTISNIEKIMEANGITDPARLKVGKKIVIPDID